MSCRDTVILGIDPGGEVTGFGVLACGGGRSRLVECGVTRAVRGEDTPGRLLRIYSFVQELIARFNPDALVVEDIYYGRNARSMKALGQVRGVVVLAGATGKIPVFEYTANEVKKAVVGRGDASKEQVQRMVQAVLGLSVAPEPHDASDAVAIALCHSHRGPRGVMVPEAGGLVLRTSGLKV